jgi:protein-S-isoprenylcysteine O-methyltransferase Ste14
MNKILLESAQNYGVKDHPAIRLPPPLVLLVAAGLGAIISMLVPMPLTRKGWPRLAGVPLLAAAVGIVIAARQRMVNLGTTPHPGHPTTALVTQGPYRFTRNPIYLGMTLLITALGLLANSMWFLPLAAAFVLTLQTQVIRYEETYLENKFGADYRAYKEQVRRWI